MSYGFFMPNISLMGEGALEDAGNENKKLGFKKALVVTDKVLVEVKLVDVLLKVLDNVDVAYKIFDGTHPNPTKKNVNDGIKIFKDTSCDFMCIYYFFRKIF